MLLKEWGGYVLRSCADAHFKCFSYSRWIFLLREYLWLAIPNELLKDKISLLVLRELS
jgi:hypothetical protein